MIDFSKQVQISESSAEQLRAAGFQVEQQTIYTIPRELATAIKSLAPTLETEVVEQSPAANDDLTPEKTGKNIRRWGNVFRVDRTALKNFTSTNSTKASDAAMVLKGHPTGTEITRGTIYKAFKPLKLDRKTCAWLVAEFCERGVLVPVSDLFRDEE